jgi:hypothetical protein
LAEGLTITLGILAAFAIDAWWSGVQESKSDQANLESVLRELRTTASMLDDAVRLDAIDTAPFLSSEQKRAIFYDNAVRFLKLPG